MALSKLATRGAEGAGVVSSVLLKLALPRYCGGLVRGSKVREKEGMLWFCPRIRF